MSIPCRRPGRMDRTLVILGFLILPCLGVGLVLNAPLPTSSADGAGRDIPVRRAVIFAPVLWDYLTVDSGARHIRAAAAFLDREIATGLLARVYPEAAHLPVAHTQGANTAIPGDLEQILSLDPDAVLTLPWFAAPLKQVGLRVVKIVGADQAKYWGLLAAIAGRQDRVARLSQDRDALERRILAQAPKPARPLRVLYVLRFTPRSVYVSFGRDDTVRRLGSLGAVSVTEDNKGPVIGREQLLTLAPDVIVLSGYAAPGDVRALFSDPVYRSVPAVKSGRIYHQPRGGSRMTGPVEEPLELDWLAEILYPETMPRQFRALLRDSYLSAYGVALGDDDIDRSLLWDENRQSLGFDRFARTDSSPSPQAPEPPHAP